MPFAASSISPALRATAPRERAALVAEQLDIQHALGEHGAVRLDHRTDASRQTMNRAREQRLARARLAGDQHRRIGRRDALEQREHRVHRRVLRDDFGRRVDARQPRLQIAILARELMLLPRAPHEDVDLGHAIRLRHVVVRAELHRVDRRLDRAVAGDDDDLRRIGLGRADA